MSYNYKKMDRVAEECGIAEENTPTSRAFEFYKHINNLVEESSEFPFSHTTKSKILEQLDAFHHLYQQHHQELKNKYA